MPDAIITSTESTFGTISGTFAADQSTISGTILGPVAGSLSGSVGVPGPAGPGVPAGGLEGQIIVKASDTDYDTVWVDNAAETLTATVRNETGATLTKGTVVYINGAAGNKATVTKASASSESASSKTFAILSANILNNQNGTAVTVGLLKGVDTSAFSPGANLWLSTMAGEITQTPPASPNHAVFLGNAVRIHANQGEIEVRIQNGLELGELHDVLIHDVANGQVLKYDSAQGLWVNGTDVGGVAWGSITGTLSDQTDLQTALNAKYDASNPSGFITSSALSPYLTTASASATYQTLSGMADYLSKAGNLSGLASVSTARDNLGLGSLSTPTFAGVTVQGSGSNVANLTPTSLSLTHATSGSFVIQPSVGITFPDATVQTTAYPGPPGATTWGSITGTLSSQTDLQTALDGKYSTSNPAGYITSSALTGYATESFVTSQGYITSAALSPYLLSSTAASIYAPIASPTFTGLATFNNPGNFAITLDGGAVGFYTSASSGVYSIVNSGTEVIRLSAGGIKYPDGVTQTVAYPGPSGFLLKADNLSGLASASTARTNLGLGTMATATAADYSTTTVANGLYYPLASNPAGYLTSASLSGYATESWVTSQGYITSSALTPYATLASPALTGNPTAPTPATADNDTSIATTAFVKAQGYLTSAPVTSVAGRTGAVTLSTSDISGLGTIATVNDAPSDGTTYGRNNGAWVAAGGGGGGTDYQAFTTPGTHTWTKPAGAKWVEVLMIGGGGGGASGARQATTVARAGGNGATSGAYVVFRVNASALSGTETVVVGAGGAGGAARTTDSTAGVPGSNGENSTFFGYTANGGGNTITGKTGYNQGSAGLVSTNAGGGNTGAGVNGVGINVPSSTFPGTGAGGGAGAAASSTASAAGGNGGNKFAFGTNNAGRSSQVLGGSGGTTSGTLPTSGVAWNVTGQIPTGSGGGAYRSGQNGMNGADGALYGGAGGGGSASDNGFPSGAGGNGGNGAVFIITYC